MANKSNYIEKEELQKVKDTHEKISNISLNLAKLSLAKDELKEALKKVNTEQEILKKLLEEKYGNVNISLADGKITKQEKIK
tara:strand:- start:42 stop:287 length:246 start_codon:yes stop_codon:yes gene_type:complete